MGFWLPLLCVLGMLTAETYGDQCHNSPCTQTNFREYSSCIQSSCNSNCQCSNVRCSTCQTADQCCQRCCQNTNYVQSSCYNNNCQSYNCPNGNCQSSNCQINNCQTNNCQAREKRTCADINCRTCRGEECMGCCEFSSTTEQSGEPNTRPPIYRPPPPPPQPPTTCNVTNVFKPNISMPNITITINQPPIHITTGPVMNNISVPCPSQGSLTCPNQNNTIVVVHSNSTNCCNISTTRCVQTSNPAWPYCYNNPQPTCGPQCLAWPMPFIPPYIPQPPPQYVAPYNPPPPPRYVVPYIQPQPINIPRYVQPQPIQCPNAGCSIAAPPPQYVRMPAPQYVPMPAPQYVPMPSHQCSASGCPTAPQPYYPSYEAPRQPCPPSGCQTGVGGGYQVVAGGCVGQWPYVRCGASAGPGYYPGTGGNMKAMPLPGAALYPYNMPAETYGHQYYMQPNGSYLVIAGDPFSDPTLALREGGSNARRQVGMKKSSDVNDAAEDDEEDTSE